MRETKPPQGDKARAFESYITLGYIYNAIMPGFSSAELMDMH